MVEKVWEYVYSYRHNTRTWQTPDRRTPQDNKGRAVEWQKAPTLFSSSVLTLQTPKVVIVLHPIIRSWYTDRWWVGLVQRGGAWAGCGPAQFPPRCTKCTVSVCLLLHRVRLSSSAHPVRLIYWRDVDVHQLSPAFADGKTINTFMHHLTLQFLCCLVFIRCVLIRYTLSTLLPRKKAAVSLLIRKTANNK